jgi:vacuolar-type H+-ATPase subunit C/Vma6
MRLYEIENCKGLGTCDQKNQTQGFLPLDKKLYRKYIQNLDNIIRDSKRILMIA